MTTMFTPTLVTGRIGRRPPSLKLVGSKVPGCIIVTCANNKQFWMSIECSTWHVQATAGPDGFGGDTLKSDFYIEHTLGGSSVYCRKDPSFFVFIPSVMIKTVWSGAEPAEWTDLTPYPELAEHCLMRSETLTPPPDEE